MKPDPVQLKQYMPTQAPPRSPMDAKRDMVGLKDISRHERAEESIREYFRQFLRRFTESIRIDKKV